MVPNNPLQVDEDSIQTDTFNLRIGKFNREHPSLADIPEQAKYDKDIKHTVEGKP
jgi:hypothetical protein